jgi:UDP-N-acetylmuramyl pentapeptide synthase
LYEEKFSLACDTVKTVFVNVDAVSKIPRFNDNKTVVSSGKEGNVTYESVIVDKTTQKFVIKGKYKYDIECSLLADYVPSMLTLAVAVAEQFQISQKNIKNSIKTLKPIAHRLEILYNDKDVIIDDAYNSNESGFISAINLLSTFEDKVKVVITPGVVELGERQSEVNRNLATYAYSRADYLLTYGVNADAIKSGAKEKCEVYANLDECMRRYKSIQGERAVLFENDLPDTY